jgi:hypothetical protein
MRVPCADGLARTVRSCCVARVPAGNAARRRGGRAVCTFGSGDNAVTPVSAVLCAHRSPSKHG